MAVTQKAISASFNPRTHMGCDDVFITECFKDGLFQSTHPHGVRLGISFLNRRIVQFQSTHPHGVRRNTYPARNAGNSFNPRTHMGCDLWLTFMVISWKSFNPRTHMGCDLFRQVVLSNICLFQSTHPHGVRHLAVPCIGR